MNYKSMNYFLSEENIKSHFEHVRTKKLELSILEKSIPELKNKSASEIINLNIKREIKNEALELIWYIKSHECFFNSFCKIQKKNDNLLRHYSSKEKYLYDLYNEAMSYDYGFLYLYLDRKGLPKTHFTSNNDSVFEKYRPKLALDLCEHTYFWDYGFQKDKFLRNAFVHLDISKLS